MSTTIENQTLKVTISAKVGINYLMENSFSVPNINEVTDREFTIPVTETDVMLLSTSAAAGTYAKSKLKFVCITNKDDTNFLRLRLKKIATNRISLLGNIVASPGSSGYVNGTYINVPLTGGTGTGALATIVVGGSPGGRVLSVTLTTKGNGYTAGDALSASNTNLGGTGTGFQIPVSSVESVSWIFDTKIDAGKFFVLGNSSISPDNGTGNFVTFEDIESIRAQADTDNVDIHLYVASI